MVESQDVVTGSGIHSIANPEPVTQTRSPEQRWGTCCPHDPECEHSFMSSQELRVWMSSPIDDKTAADYDGN